jgi:hypothetical protein
MANKNKIENQKKIIREQLGLPIENLSVSPKYKDEKMVTVEVQKEFDVLDKSWENKVFVKLFVAARTSGLLKKISDREFKTLIALALYMDENGDCFPSQDQVARDLGISRVTANRRIQSLLRFRFNGEPIVTAVRLRNKGGTWENVRYTILPVAHLKIFEKSDKNEPNNDHVSKTLHGEPCNSSATWQNRYTNKNNTLNKNQFNNVKSNAVSNKKKEKRSEDKEYLASYIAEQLEDDHSLGFFRKVVDLVPENLIYQALSEVKDTSLTGKIKKNKAALFTTVIKAKAIEHNISFDVR